MRGSLLLYGFMRQALPVGLLATLLLGLAGCSTTRTLPTPEQQAFCAADPGGIPPQSAPDDCLKEICREGHLESVEELKEMATVYGWAEEGFCFFHPIDCYGALSVRDHVRQWEQDKAKAGMWDTASLQGGLGDAARHTYLACLLTERYGGAFAKGLLDAHEEDSTMFFGLGKATAGNRCCDKLMDLHNNRVGTELAGQPGDCEGKVISALPRLRHSLCRP